MAPSNEPVCDRYESVRLIVDDENGTCIEEGVGREESGREAHLPAILIKDPCETLLSKITVHRNRQSLLLISVCINVLCMVILLSHQLKTNGDQAVVVEQGWVRPKVVYGFVHMAKTAGTEINGELASHYERVCGNKGYSYDYYQQNKRFRKKLKTRPYVSDHADLGDIVSKYYHKMNRGAPPFVFQDEVGFEDCDLIALETHSKHFYTDRIATQVPVELHIPCREPLNHLMSKMHMAGEQFDCTKQGEELRQQVSSQAGHGGGRFHKYWYDHPNITMRCFDPMPPKRYVEWMGKPIQEGGGGLQRKRIENDYVHRASNTFRNKTLECIWTQPEEYKQQVRDIMVENEYYKFCHACIGSNDELPL